MGFLCVQVLQAKTKVANGRVFDMAIKLSQGDLPDQIMKVNPIIVGSANAKVILSVYLQTHNAALRQCAIYLYQRVDAALKEVALLETIAFSLG